MEMYGYVNAGGVSKKRVRIIGTPFGSSTVNMDAGYTYDGEGRVLSTTYPGSQYNSNGTVSGGANYNYSYDTLGRLQAMSDSVSNTTWVSGVTYGPADEMLSMTANGFTETRTYNANLQLTDLISGANVHLKYNYSASQNNGQILSQDDLVSGETIGYQYDSLKRLTQANATGDPSGSWQQNFGYDGFGNLTNKTSTNAPQLSVAVDWATNRIQSFAGYDNNGNMTGYAGDVYSYNLQNRMIQAGVSGGGTVRYGYDTTNHRVYKGGYNGGTTTYSAEEFYFYGAEGHKYGTWQINPSTGVLLQASVTKQWFGGRLVSPEDRLGSKGRYFAFGEERTNVSPANPPNDQEKFATYTRDSATGLDYANQRYFSSIVGRFTKPDHYGGSANPTDPQSWNRYTYVQNNPINKNDPTGKYECFGQVSCPDDTDPGYYDDGPISETSPGYSPQLSFDVTCFIALKYRPVFFNYNHAYIYITKTITWSDGRQQKSTDLVEALPERNTVGDWGQLVGHTFYNFDPSLPNQDPSDHPATDPTAGSWIGVGLDDCKKGADIENLSESGYFSMFKYDPTAGSIYNGGQNSNWFAWYELANVGLSLGVPPNAPGFPSSPIYVD